MVTRMYWSNISQRGSWHHEKENNAKHITKQPEKKSPAKSVFEKLLVHFHYQVNFDCEIIYEGRDLHSANR